jgi:hypothetical protein
MSATTIAQATQTILQSALTSQGFQANVLLGIPKVLNDNIVLYIYHDGSTDADKAGPGVVRRTHIVPVHLLVLTTADDAETENLLMALHDAISDAFYTNHTLGGAAVAADLLQANGDQRSGVQYVLQGGAEYRHRWWTLHAAEDRVFTFS